MPDETKVYRVEFKYTRTVVFHVEAVDEEHIDDFLTENIDWEPVGDLPEIVDEDDQVVSPEYVVEPSHNTANYELVDGELREKEHA